VTPLSLVALASLCVAAPAPAPAGAGGTAADQAPAARAEALLREGVQRRLQGNEQEAYALFAAADELLPSPRAKAQMGLAAKSLKRYAEAERLLQTALAARDDPWIEAHRPTLAQALAFVARARAPAAEPPPAPGPPAPSLPAPAFASPAPAPSGARRLVLASAAVGAVGLTAGTVLGIRAWQLRGERDDVCPTVTCPSAAGGA
jgi:tetratricopeptide (TPR) repeat protein